ncbi:3-carboxy-cis,cis-muconate cycloisomerase [Micrococcus sp. 140720015-1]
MAAVDPLAPTADVGLLSPVWAAGTVAETTSDRAVLGHLLEVEAAWVDVLARRGLASAAEAEQVRSACDPAEYDQAEIARAAQGGGNPLIPTLRALRTRLPAGAAATVHRGATSQDVVDTALMLMVARAARDLTADLRAAVGALSRLALTHRTTPMVARSLTQHSLPSTFGLRAATWLDGLAQATRRLERATTDLPIQWGGAAGTLASLSGHVERARRAGGLADEVTAFDLVEDLAAELGLSAPPAPWNTNRMAVTGVAAALADVVAACGRIANDVLIAARIEIGELGEPTAPGRGGSSAMPHKQNPVLSVLVRSAALSAPGVLAQVHTAAGAADDDRPSGAWHAEWPALRQLLRLAGGAAALTRELTAGLRVDEDRMRQNLGRTGPALVSERLVAELAPVIDAAAGQPGAGRDAIHAVVDDALAGRGEFGALLRAAVPASVGDDRLAELCDPAGYTGEAAALVDRIVAAHADLAAD